MPVDAVDGRSLRDGTAAPSQRIREGYCTAYDAPMDDTDRVRIGGVVAERRLNARPHTVAVHPQLTRQRRHMSTTSMSVEERDSFLAGLHVGIIGIERADGPPLVVPVWYSYEPGGEVVVLLDGDSLKGRLLERAGRFSLCAQDENPPYKYVSVEGPATITASDTERDTRPMARRYLGDDGGDRYTDTSPPSARPIRVAMRPERWFTVDYSKLQRP